MASRAWGRLAMGAILGGFGCSGGDGTAMPPDGTPPPGGMPPSVLTPGTAGPTAVGVPTGPASRLKVGAAGGTLASADGRVKLVVPPGALANEVELEMTPLSNETPLGLGYAVRLEPSGTTFTVPAKLVFAYEAWASSTVPELLLGATQDSDNSWKVAGAPALDTAAKTLSVEVPHFSDWSLSTCARLISSTYVLTPGMEADLVVEEQCQTPTAGTTLGAFAPTTQPVSWSKKDRENNPGPGQLTPNGATAKLVGETATTAGDPIVRVIAEWTSPAGKRVLSDEIATSSVVSFTVEGRSVIVSQGAFVRTLGGKTSINAASDNGSLALAVNLSGVGSVSTAPFDGFTASCNVGTTNYGDTYNDSCTSAALGVTTVVTVGRANRERQYITGTFDGTMTVTRGTVDCSGTPTATVQKVPLTGAFFALWLNYGP